MDKDDLTTDEFGDDFNDDFSEDITTDIPQDFHQYNFDKNQSYIDMIQAHKSGDVDKASEIFSNIISHKTTEMLNGWYHMSGNLKNHLNKVSEK